LLPIYGAYEPSGLNMALKGIPTYPRSRGITNDKLGDEFMTSMGEKDVCLLRGHGVTTAGRDVEQSVSNAFTIFELARMNYLAYAIGDPKPVPQEDIDEATPGSEANQRRPRHRREYDRAAPMWRYYRQLLGEA
jgi:3,4-dihydroxyphthalate decarboxylase